jgi:hypothetical protein
MGFIDITSVRVGGGRKQFGDAMDADDWKRFITVDRQIFAGRSPPSAQKSLKAGLMPNFRMSHEGGLPIPLVEAES